MSAWKEYCSFVFKQVKVEYFVHINAVIAFVTVTSSKATQSQDSDIIQSNKTHCKHISNKSYNYRSQGEQIHSRAIPLLMLWDAVTEGAAGRQPASRWHQTQRSHMTWEEAATKPVQCWGWVTNL